MAKKKAADAPAKSADAAAEYTVLARRYRPQQFADLVGQEPVAQALINAIKSNRVAHAYLFTGSRGVGKTSAARILAKALNCATGPTATPCDQCENCQAIASGDDIDVLEIDGASNNSVDDVRELRQNAQYRPARSRYKIYIIDEVHMLAASAFKSAFNALLKTLEEPPMHVKFIFATTEVQKIPATILSRCQRFDFAGIGAAQITERLRAIVTSERMQAEDEALEMIARRAAGSMRDAQSLLDQLLAFGGAKLTADRVHELLGTAHEERVAALAAAVVSRDAKQALALLAKVVDQGQQLGELLDQLIEYWRDLMVVQCAGLEGQSVSVSSKYRDDLKKQAQSLTPDTIVAGLDVLASAKTRMRFTAHGRIVLEIALVRLCQLDNLLSLSQLALALTKDGAATSAGATAGTARVVPAASTVSTSEKKKVEDDGNLAAISLPLLQANLPAIRQQLLMQAGLTVGSELRRVSSLAISAPNSLVLQVPARYNLRSEQILEGQRRTEVEGLLTKIVGQPCRVSVEIVAEEANGQAANADAPRPEPPHEKARRQRQELMLMPIVSKAIQALGAQVVGVDDDFAATAAAPAVGGGEQAEQETD